MTDLPEDLLVTLARQGGLALTHKRAARLWPLLESLMTRLGRIGGPD